MTLTQSTVSRFTMVGKEYELSKESCIRKEQGAFYTDVELASKIITFLSLPVNATVLDPCCGVGNFLVAAQLYGCISVYGADIDKGAVKIGREHTGLDTVKVLDTINENGATTLRKLGLKEKADYVIGNPPYVPIEKNVSIYTKDYVFVRNVKDSGNNLFVAALLRAFELCKENGIISYIIPKNFLHVSTYSLLRKRILNEKAIISIVDLGAYFKDVRGEQIILTFRNSPANGKGVDFYQYSSGKFIKKVTVSQSEFSDEIIIFDNEKDHRIYRKLESSYQKFSDICKDYVGRGKGTVAEGAISGKDIRKFGLKNGKVPDKGNQIFIQNIYSAESGIIACFGGKLSASETVTVFTDGDEKMCRYVLGFLHSRLCNYYLYKFCYNSSRLTMHTDAKYLKRLPLKTDKNFDQVVNIVKLLEGYGYLEDIWFESVEKLNELIFDSYGLSQEESSYINSEMKSINSKRWSND